MRSISYNTSLHQTRSCWRPHQHSPFASLFESQWRLASTTTHKSKYKASTSAKKLPNNINQWNLPHRHRALLRWLGYWSPRIVLIIWGVGFVAAGLYIGKKSIDTDGFTTQFTEGTGGDVGMEDWTMIDHNGEQFCKDDTVGKYMLIYFGFTFCPDVCPIEMKKLSEIADRLKEKGIGLDIVQPTFVSVDYRRDTPDMIKNYIKEYVNGDDKKILGLCGTRDQIEHYARVMKTYFSDPPQLEEDYILEHSTYMYFTGKDGAFKNLTNTEDGAEVLANKIALWVAEDKGKFSKMTEQVKQAFS